MSTKLIVFLMTMNLIVSVLAFCEGNWKRGIYWFGASLINFSIAIMK